MATKNNSRIWSLIALLTGLVVGLSYVMDWLGLSVDGIVRDELVINDVAIKGSDISSAIAVLVLGAAIGLFAVIALARPRPVLGWLVAVGGIGAVGYAAYVYLSRDDLFTQMVVDRVASDDVPAEAVERAVGLALRGGVDVLPKAGLFAAGVAGIVAVVAGLLMSRVAAVEPAGAVVVPEPTAGAAPAAAPEAGATADPTAEPEVAVEQEPEPATTEGPTGGPHDEQPPPDDSAMWRN